jgi:2-polyprenyl-6-methoxyphenol hydroxylase-like FAD-dependent oxidoreductase
MHTQVAVIGGDIGGLGAALSLFRAGFDVQVYEQAHTLREVGAGIQVSPECVAGTARIGSCRQIGAPWRAARCTSSKALG